MQAVRVKAMAMVEQAAGDALQALQQPTLPAAKTNPGAGCWAGGNSTHVGSVRSQGTSRGAFCSRGKVAAPSGTPKARRPLINLPWN